MGSQQGEDYIPRTPGLARTTWVASGVGEGQLAGLSLPTKPPNPRAWTKDRDNQKSPLGTSLEREGSYLPQDALAKTTHDLHTARRNRNHLCLGTQSKDTERTGASSPGSACS